MNCNYCNGSGAYRTWDKQSGRTDEVQCVCWQRRTYYAPVERKNGKDPVIEAIRKRFGDKAILKGER